MDLSKMMEGKSVLDDLFDHDQIIKDIKNADKHLDCIRCGVCCAGGSCIQGKHMPNSCACEYLILDVDGIASCTLVLEGKVKPVDVGINGSGCVLRKISVAYKWDRMKLLYIKNELIRRGEKWKKKNMEKNVDAKNV
jgi:hypothetical protein